MERNPNDVLRRGHRREGLPGVYRGEVVKVEADARLWVVVPRLSGSSPVGPLPTVVFPRPAVAGDRVLVQALEGAREQLIVTGLLARHA